MQRAKKPIEWAFSSDQDPVDMTTHDGIRQRMTIGASQAFGCAL
jgi:hypothetical protein